MINTVKLALEQGEYLALLKVAISEFRNPTDQARYMLRQELERRGLLNQDHNKPAPTSPGPTIISNNLPPASVTTNISPVKKKTLSRRILTAIFVSLPGILGRFILDIFGRDKASESSSIFLGYGVMVVSLLILLGIFDFDTLLHTFKEIWRFFSPVEK